MKTVALPMETKVREFHGKLWLGLKLVERGYEVVLGPAGEVRSTLDVTRPDIYVTKDPGDPSIEFFDALRSAGIRVCGLDPEGGVFAEVETYIQKKARALDHLDAYFAWGELQANALQEAYGGLENVYVTGNPRFDLLQSGLRSVYRDGGNRHKREFGDYILVNTSFGMANPVDEELVKRNVEKVIDFEPGWFNFRSRIYHLFVEALYYLVADSELSFVIRPHPSEDHQTYEYLFRNYDTAHVEADGDVRSWIHGAEAVVHHDCTTGIESALMGKPVISYQPIQDDEFSVRLPQLVSERVPDREALRSGLLKHHVRGDRFSMGEETKAELKRYFDNVETLAVDRICDVIDDLEVDSPRFDRLQPNLRGELERRVKASSISPYVVTAYDLSQTALGNDMSRKRRRARNQRFSGLDYTEILECIRIFDGHVDLPEVEVESVPLTGNTYRIRP